MISNSKIFFINYRLREITPKFIINLIPRVIRKKYVKKIFKYYFLPTNLKTLPDINYYSDYEKFGNEDYQKELIHKFNDTKKIDTNTTSPHLTQLLLMKFNSEEDLNFLDFGGENISLYLELNKHFKKIKYYVINLKSINQMFEKIKHQYNFNNLHIINDLEEVFNHQFDFVNFGSVIQYVENYEYILNKITDNSNYIYFSATHLYNSSENNTSKNYLVKQVVTYPDTPYLYFFNKEKFYEIFFRKKYKLIFEEKNLTDKVNYDNFKEYLKDIRYCDFLFKKII